MSSEINRLLKQFKLPDIHDRYDEEVQAAVENNIGHREFLYKILKVEEQGKMDRLRIRNIKNAHFEGQKTIEEFDFNFSKKINKTEVIDLFTLSFMDKKENIVFIGPPGLGKSHLSEAIGMKACEKGKSVLFVNAIDLMDELYGAIHLGTLKQKFVKLSKVNLLIIDDIGYLKMDKEKESIFFQLIRQRYEKSSLIVTTNLPFNQWDEIFTSELAATAVLDRLLHHSHIISITGDSHRVNRYFEEA
ncbi:IS21-like element helper ATPase IstB [Clostridium psychrophilum]|uniref:IS21-like element helper ATPase IstB n=1 Tax=Clostridium psychrophilum TaxID=132926 RepID=UPI001FE52062|nr:IS21-like element helper ATPase IstB [Clostridium psychrophilum]